MMDFSGTNSQYVPTICLRRTSTGSLTSLKKIGKQPFLRDSSSSRASSNVQRPNPIAGGSWDDNSLGQGSVAARMRRDRNRVIQQTRSPSSYVSNAVNTHVNITSTLNLINTTALSHWKEDDPLPWDLGYDLMKDMNYSTASSKRSAGSLCNIPSSGAPQQWDSRSIPEHIKSRSTRRTPYRHSYTSANQHSNPTSGCASVAGSDIDSSDLAFFSMTDDSSFFDGDSLFSESYGVHDADSGFSTNIFNLLEEGTISCRTPFLNGDWPDSISELDFDCSEQQANDLSNCDAHSDIGPSCSIPGERHRLKKRPVRSQMGNQSTLEDVYRRKANELPALISPSNLESRLPPQQLEIAVTPVQDSPYLNTSPPTPLQCLPPVMDAPINVDSFLVKSSNSQKAKPTDSNLQSTLVNDQRLSPMSLDDAEETRTVVGCDVDAFRNAILFQGASHVVNLVPVVPTESKPAFSQTLACDITAEDSGACYGKKSDSANGTSSLREVAAIPVVQTLASNLKDWGNLPLQVKLDLIEQLSNKINETMSLQEQMDISRILGTSNPDTKKSFHVSIDDIDSHKLSRLLGYLDTHKLTDALASNDTKSPPSGELRRSNSDGNIAKSVSDAQKEHRRQQRQARRFAKWLKQRQRKESRQQLKEQRSGLFLNEMKVRIQAEEEEDIEVDI